MMDNLYDEFQKRDPDAPMDRMGSLHKLPEEWQQDDHFIRVGSGRR